LTVSVGTRTWPEWMTICPMPSWLEPLPIKECNEPA
jgi:hypothetical protein